LKVKIGFVSLTILIFLFAGFIHFKVGGIDNLIISFLMYAMLMMIGGFALSLSYIVNYWLENKAIDIDNLNILFIKACKPLPIVRIMLLIGAITVAACLIDEYLM
jgi:hypothetical protein